jgi:hypothetical protein
LASRHRGDLIELVAQSVDHKTLCLSFFTRPLLGIPQRLGGIFYDTQKPALPSCCHFAATFKSQTQKNHPKMA